MKLVCKKLANSTLSVLPLLLFLGIGLSRVRVIVNEYGLAQHTFSAFEIGYVRRFLIGTVLDIFYNMEDVDKSLLLNINKGFALFFLTALVVFYLRSSRYGKYAVIAVSASIITPVGVSIYGFPELLGYSLLMFAYLFALVNGRVWLLLSLLFYILAILSSEISIIAGFALYLLFLSVNYGVKRSVMYTLPVTGLLSYYFAFVANLSSSGGKSQLRMKEVFGELGEYAYAGLVNGFDAHFNTYQGGSHHAEYLFREVFLWSFICSVSLLVLLWLSKPDLSIAQSLLFPMSTTMPIVLSYLGNDWSRWQFVIGLNYLLSFLLIVRLSPVRRIKFKMIVFLLGVVALEIFSSNQGLYDLITIDDPISGIKNLLTFFTMYVS
ncbi:MAG: hypothetical protein ACKOW9_00125 [Candidatus Paceibacterota bacterium]